MSALSQFVVGHPKSVNDARNAVENEIGYAVLEFGRALADSSVAFDIQRLKASSRRVSRLVFISAQDVPRIERMARGGHRLRATSWYLLILVAAAIVSGWLLRQLGMVLVGDILTLSVPLVVFVCNICILVKLSSDEAFLKDIPRKYTGLDYVSD